MYSCTHICVQVYLAHDIAYVPVYLDLCAFWTLGYLRDGGIVHREDHFFPSTTPPPELTELSFLGTWGEGGRLEVIFALCPVLAQNCPD